MQIKFTANFQKSLPERGQGLSPLQSSEDREEGESTFQTSSDCEAFSWSNKDPPKLPGLSQPHRIEPKRRGRAWKRRQRRGIRRTTTTMLAIRLTRFTVTSWFNIPILSSNTCTSAVGVEAFDGRRRHDAPLGLAWVEEEVGDPKCRRNWRIKQRSSVLIS